MSASLVGSEMCIRDRRGGVFGRGGSLSLSRASCASRPRPEAVAALGRRVLRSACCHRVREALLQGAR
eukprot:12618121-Alexandrium_andersonii.AAC.1